MYLQVPQRVSNLRPQTNASREIMNSKNARFVERLYGNRKKKALEAETELQSSLSAASRVE